MEEITKSAEKYLNARPVNKELTLLNSQGEILKALLTSKHETTTIGIQCIALGSETIVTSVEDIIFEEGRTVVVLKHYDTSGYILPSHKLYLEEIQGVFPFATPFVNPYINNIDKDKDLVLLVPSALLIRTSQHKSAA